MNADKERATRKLELTKALVSAGEIVAKRKKIVKSMLEMNGNFDQVRQALNSLERDVVEFGCVFKDTMDMIDDSECDRLIYNAYHQQIIDEVDESKQKCIDESKNNLTPAKEIEDLKNDVSIENKLNELENMMQRNRESIESQSTGNMEKTMKSIVATLQLPRKQMKCFDGNPLEYWTFIQTFNTNIGSKDIDDGSKLSCLLTHCTGKAGRAVRSTAMMPPQTGYRRALKILQKRFGNSVEISQHWVNKITDMPGADNAESLQDFADELQCCYEMLQNMDQLDVMDNSICLKKIWMKLPQQLQDEWVGKHYEIRTKRRDTAKFKDLVDFITDCAEVATDPVFSNRSSQVRSSAIMTPVSPAIHCPSCAGNHYLQDCPHSGVMTMKEQMDAVKTKGLCVNCCRNGDIDGECQRTFTCDINACDKKDNRPLHMPEEQGAVQSDHTVVGDVVMSATPVQHERSYFSVQSESGAPNSGLRRPCPCCSKGHSLTRCSKFAAMDIKRRIALFMRKGLCMTCHVKGHISKDCRSNFICGVNGCFERHSKVLHQ